MTEIKVVLLDDEIPCTETLAMQINGLDLNINIIQKFNDPVEALAYITNHDFDILFLDIEMPEISGFGLLNQINNFNFDVVFTTAYNQYAIEAFKFSALNYLLKPIDDDELHDCFTMWQRKNNKMLNKEQFSYLISLIDQHNSTPKKIAIPVSDGYEFINTEMIIRCQADNYYTHFLMTNEKDILVCRTLKEVEALLKPFGFIRIHQSHLINPTHIKKFSRQDGGTILTSDDVRLSVSKSHKNEVISLLEKLNKL